MENQKNIAHLTINAPLFWVLSRAGAELLIAKTIESEWMCFGWQQNDKRETKVSRQTISNYIIEIQEWQYSPNDGSLLPMGIVGSDEWRRL